MNSVHTKLALTAVLLTPDLLMAAEEGTSVFTVDFGLMFWTWILFLLTVGVLSWKAFPAIAKGLESRTAFIDEAIEGAKADREEARRLLDEHQRQLDEAKTSLLDRGIDEARAEELAPHLAMPGNRPNSVITMDALTPATLGALLALYEHRTFCSGVLWGINSFDQWGVELGKEIGVQILGLMSDEESDAEMDAATERLISEWRSAQ